MSTNIEYKTIAHLFELSKFTVCVIVHQVCEAIVERLSPRYVQIPTGNRLLEMINVFEQKCGFPQCAGTLDGSHIPILAPTECHTDYFNRKGILLYYTSLLAQIINFGISTSDGQAAYTLPVCFQDLLFTRK